MGRWAGGQGRVGVAQSSDSFQPKPELNQAGQGRVGREREREARPTFHVHVRAQVLPPPDFVTCLPIFALAVAVCVSVLSLFSARPRSVSCSKLAGSYVVHGVVSPPRPSAWPRYLLCPVYWCVSEVPCVPSVCLPAVARTMYGPPPQ